MTTAAGTTPSNGGAPDRDGADPVVHEQKVVDTLYALLGDEVGRTRAALAKAATDDVGSTPSAILEREALVRSHAQRLTALEAAEHRLVFGRIDRTDGATFHLGRVGLAEPDGGARALLDWRAPAAAAFYQATGANPMGLKRRRHLHTRDRRVTDVVDELLELTGGAPEDASLDSNSALLAALDAPRDGRMHEVVATIQAEQDRIIRAPLRGVLVVQGAPGTGKTVVALHRAAYLLYTYRQQLRSGVLVVGPGNAFLDYIGQVLPSLGETGATLMSLGGFHAGAEVTGTEAPRLAALKGDLRMAQVLRRAVGALPRVPDSQVALDVEGERIFLRPNDVASAMRPAHAENSRHNEARVTFVREILERLLRSLARATGYAPEDVNGETRVELLRALHASRDVRREVNRCWPLTTPERLLRKLYRDPAFLERAAVDLTPAERDLLFRADPGDGDPGWTVADVALLDEAAELLGEDPEPKRRAAALRASAHADEVRYARRVSEMVGGDGTDSEQLAARYTGYDGPVDDDGTVRTYGHVVVDEAQELTPMQWRSVLRRCPGRSLTVVGDMAQATSPGAATSWPRALRPHLRERWETVELTVNYRLPREINDLAHDVLLATGGHAGTTRARAVRDGVEAVRRHPVAPAAVEDLVVELAAKALAEGPGTVGVVTTAGRRAALARAVAHLERAAVLTAVQAKGLEFDTVLAVEPAEILGEAGPRGLYVALTRATQRLHVLGDLPGTS